MKPVTFPMMLIPSIACVRLAYLAGTVAFFAVLWALVVATVAALRALISPSARLYSLGNTFTNLPRDWGQVSSSSRALAAGPAVVLFKQLLQLGLVALVPVPDGAVQRGFLLGG